MINDQGKVSFLTSTERKEDNMEYWNGYLSNRIVHDLDIRTLYISSIKLWYKKSGWLRDGLKDTLLCS